MRTKHLFIIFTVLFISTCVIIFLYIRANIGIAAQFTDNVLRPILGNQTVGTLEKTYFNTTDKMQMAIHSNQTVPLDEQQWKTITPEISYKKVKSDLNRPYSVTTLAKIKMNGLILGDVAGKSQPGGPIGNYGPGKIPSTIARSRLIAAFDGGFQYKDGKYGMIVDGITYLPLKNNIGTIVGYKNGQIQIINYQGQNLGSNVAFVRQNCPILIENGQVFAQNEEDKKLWGRTFGSDIYTWRSGLGIDKNGNLIYAVGNNLSPVSLASALTMGGAVNAIQLDINPFWVRFNLFNPNKTLTQDLKDGSYVFLNGYSKDFFYIYKI